ncbi:ABC transporter [Mycena sanguinolenta]|uniref:ABC transporter n=1 Tax=Mycena sanguinolenta TaxID=230812 RepID=A0A8H7CN47_9AGAR|nr:ABC transporter [Mycena sanguinolenta]
MHRRRTSNIFLAIHAEWAAEPHMIPQAVALCSFMQLTVGNVTFYGSRIAGTIFRNKLKEYLAAYVNEIPIESLTAAQQSVDAIFTLPPGIPRPYNHRIHSESQSRLSHGNSRRNSGEHRSCVGVVPGPFDVF